jgi:molecular chaperone GrpE
MTEDEKKVEEEENGMEESVAEKKNETPREEIPGDDDAPGWKKKADEYLDMARRAHADLINFRKRAKRERDDAYKYAHEGFVLDLFPAMDSLKTSLEKLENATDPKAILEGVAIIEKEFLRVLQKNGVKAIETKGKGFDPLYHEAVAMEETDEVEENMIVEEVRAGWKLHDRVLRASSVRIARAPAGDAEK